MKNLCALFLISFSSVIPANAFAGAWLQPRGEGQIISNLRYYTANKFIDAYGVETKIDPFEKIELAPYAEYGLYDWLTIGGELNFASIDDKSPVISYGSVFARSYLYRQGSHVVSIEPGITLPRQTGSELSPDGENIIPELKLAYGYGFKIFERDHFFDTDIKYRMRNDGNLSDMIKSTATIGLTINNDFMALLQISDERSFRQDGEVGNYVQVKPQISLVYHDDNFSHQIGFSKDIFSLNTGQGYGFIYSLWYKF